MIMTPDLFLDCILYIINDNNDQSCKLVKDLIVLFELDSRNNTTIDDEITRFYIRLLKTIMEAKVTKNNPDELRIILLKFKSDGVLAKRQEIYELLYATFLSPEKLAVEKVAQLSARIYNTLLWHRCNKSTRALYAALSRSADMVNPTDQAVELRKILTATEDIGTAFASKSTATALPRSLIEHIDMSDKSSMLSALQKNRERSVTGVIKLGLQGLNRMLGERGGLALGESMVVYALPHHYKSGLLMSIATWVPLYNTPAVIIGETMLKPLILLISVENEAHQNFVWMFRHHYETINQQSSKHLNDDDVADWCYTMFSGKGYTLIIERHLPYKFDFQSYVETVERYKRLGYQIILAAIDYANLMNKEVVGVRADSNHLAVRALFSALCNYNKTEGIAFATAHPLHRRAMELAGSGHTNVVKRFDTSHLADSFDVAREVDFEVFIHIERNIDGVPYLTMRRGKHRHVDTTPETHKYCAYRFHSQFGIHDDVNRPANFVMDIYDDPLTQDAERGTPQQPQESNVYELF